MYTLVVLIALASLGQSPEPAPAKAEAGQGQWTPLFNGKDLSGWAAADAGDNGSSWEVAGSVAIVRRPRAVLLARIVAAFVLFDWLLFDF